MAQVIIREYDKTSNPASEYSDVVYVPGLVNASVRDSIDELYYNKPVFFTSLTEFENVFTKYPAKFAAGSGVNCGYDKNTNLSSGRTTFFKEGEYDPGFIYAKELLNLGLPIYYLAIKGDKALDVYAALNGDFEQTIESLTVTATIALVSGSTDTYEATITTTFADTSRFYKINKWMLGTETATIIGDFEASAVTFTTGSSPVALVKAKFKNSTVVKNSTIVQLLKDATTFKAVIDQFTYTNGDWALKNTYEDKTGTADSDTRTLKFEVTDTYTTADKYECSNFKTALSGSSTATTTFSNDAYKITHEVGTDNKKYVVLTFESDAVVYITDLDPMLASAWLDLSGASFTADIKFFVPTEGTAVSVLSRIADRGTYNVKYISTGGYPVFEYGENATTSDYNTIVKKLLKLAGAKDNETNDFKDNPYDDPDGSSSKFNGRGDCVALIDHFNFPSRPLIGEGSVFETINGTGNYSLIDLFGTSGSSYLSYGAMYTPYAKYELSDYKESGLYTEEYIQECLPGSFAYLVCLAQSLGQTLATYESVAGVARGTVPNIVFNSTTNLYEMCTDAVLTNYIANQYNIPIGLGEDDWTYLSTGEKAHISINAITEINPYGMIIYGDRTLLEKTEEDGVKATGIVNIRGMVSDIKKKVYSAARRYVFGQNNSALWFNFKSMVTPLLDKFKSGYGIKSYTITKVEGNTDDKYAIYANINIVPIYPVEKFDITINITDADSE